MAQAIGRHDLTFAVIRQKWEIEGDLEYIDTHVYKPYCALEKDANRRQLNTMVLELNRETINTGWREALGHD